MSTVPQYLIEFARSLFHDGDEADLEALGADETVVFEQTRPGNRITISAVQGGKGAKVRQDNKRKVDTES